MRNFNPDSETFSRDRGTAQQKSHIYDDVPPVQDLPPEPPKPKKGMKLTDELITEICGYISLGNYIRTACGACGISYPVFYRWMKHGRDQKAPIYVKFHDEVKRAEAELESKVVANWQKQIPYDWHAAKEFLGRRFPKSWGAQDKNALMQLGPDGEPIEIEQGDPGNQMNLDLTLLSDEEVENLEKLVRKASKPESLNEGEGR